MSHTISPGNAPTWTSHLTTKALVLHTPEHPDGITMEEYIDLMVLSSLNKHKGE